MNNVMGIDPGLSGGIVIARWWRKPDGGLGHMPVYHCKMPIKDGRIDVERIQEIVIEYRVEFAAVEKQGVIKGQGSGLAIGTNYGFILCALILCGVQFAEVYPQTWMALRNRNLKSFDYSLPATKEKPKNATKLMTRAYCRLNDFPVPDKSNRKNTTFHDGIADAWGVVYWFISNWFFDWVPPIEGKNE